ncbi:MAG: glutamine-hydrolyzing carbamoyl-phosphate synthase small subunit [Planctomycetota bacterium]|nr:glutamine-hydrolyzing carbamoyl-phosphate synthase small subunit [Planctomycetota bacterium]
MDRVAKLALEDGTVFTGVGFGAEGEVSGEVVFNTSMTGYQEILTDPSYRGQIVTMTYPEIGNYGVNPEDVESGRPHLSGFICKENSRVRSNFRSTESLEDYLTSNGIVSLEGIDTRMLVRKLRISGAMKGILSTTDLDDTSLVNKAKNSESLVGKDLVQEVVPSKASLWNEALSEWWQVEAPTDSSETTTPHVVAMDFGMKWNIARHLVSQGFRVTVVPGNTKAEEILAMEPDGVFLSNGPGDPEPVIYAIETISALVGKVPLFGICLGHQLLALACGAKTFKLKFGHRGANHPILNLRTGRVEITTQNHGFAVSEDDLPEELEITHRNLNDDTVAGLRHRNAPAFCVQYHPEASAGPHDSQYLFDEFRNLIRPQAINT